jgi:putative oxidoreductase
MNGASKRSGRSNESRRPCANLGAAPAQHPAHHGGLLLLQHGTAKHLKFPSCSRCPTFHRLDAGLCRHHRVGRRLLLVIGLFSRPAAFMASRHDGRGLLHGPRAAGLLPILNAGELAVLYCFAFLYLAAAGPGPWSLDALRKK